MRINQVLLEQDFDYSKKELGEVTFPKSDINDPHLQKVIKDIAAQTKSSHKEVQGSVEKKIGEYSGMLDDSPILYETVHNNAAEQAVFDLFWKAGIRSKGAPQFDNVTFKRLINQLRVDYDEFFPLRSYIDKRKLASPVIRVLDDKEDKTYKEIPTAAATPNGEFLFNKDFMQAMLDYGHHIGVKPKGNKFSNNGGKFPPEYAYLEFLIMHEFMHYSNDDFYYQRVIPNANPKIINWVGDFRTNYQLVKSGFEPLPIGLYNDHINYDRQDEYVDMYNIIKEEMDRLKPEEQKMLEDLLDQLSDEHGPGNEEGKSGGGEAVEEADLDDLEGSAKANGEKVEDNEEGAGGEGDEEDGEGDDGNDDIFGDNRDEGKKGDAGKPRELDYTKINPQFDWKTLVKRFIKTGSGTPETTYSRPHRRSITTVDVARQTGAGAIKPAEKPADYQDARLMFVIDNSGSMGHVIARINAEAIKLLKTPMFKKAAVLISKFDSGSSLYKVIVAQNKAGKVDNPDSNPDKWDLNVDSVFGVTTGGGTEITEEMVQHWTTAAKQGYNAVMATDSDILWGHNLPLLLRMIKVAPKQFFLVFATKDDYVSFRQKTGINTPNITYFSD